MSCSPLRPGRPASKLIVGLQEPKSAPLLEAPVVVEAVLEAVTLAVPAAPTVVVTVMVTTVVPMLLLQLLSLLVLF